MELFPIILIFAAIFYIARWQSRATVPAKTQGMRPQTMAAAPAPASSANIAPTARSTNGVPDGANWTNPLLFQRSLGGGAVYDPASNVLIAGIFSNDPPPPVPASNYVQPAIPVAAEKQPIDVISPAIPRVVAPPSPASPAQLNSYQTMIQRYLSTYRGFRGF